MLSAQLDAGENAPFGSRVLILLQIKSIQVFFGIRCSEKILRANCWTGRRALGEERFFSARRVGRRRVGEIP